MIKISPKAHAWSDAVLLGGGSLLQWFFGNGDSFQGIYFWSAVAIGVTLNLLTDYPLGILRLIPMKVHRLVELTAPGIFIIGPSFFFPNTPTALILGGLGVLNFLTAWFTTVKKAPISRAKAAITT